MAPAAMMRIIVGPEDFDPAWEHRWLEQAGDELGAVVTFTGVVRNDAARPIAAIELEHYAPMCERILETLASEAAARWSLLAVAIRHRVGRLQVGERIVWVGTASSHRAEAFAASAFLIDFLKTRAPFWKRTWYADGTAAWVAARASDWERAERWKSSIPER